MKRRLSLAPSNSFDIDGFRSLVCEKEREQSTSYIACDLIKPDSPTRSLYHRDDIRITSLLIYRIVAESRSIIPEVDVKFLPPVMHMDKLACVGLNYSGHCQEQGIPIPESPIIFSKFPSNIIGPRDNILLPPISDVSRRRIPCVEFSIIGERERERERESVCVYACLRSVESIVWDTSSVYF